MTCLEVGGPRAKCGQRRCANLGVPGTLCYTVDQLLEHTTGLQVLALVAMEAPDSFDAESIRDGKVRVLNAVRPIDLDEVTLGQYGPGTVDGESMVGYRDEDQVPDDSETPTFIS